MSFQITVQPSGRQFDAEADETLLEAALRQEINLPYGCRDGACGSCKGQVLSGQLHYPRGRPTGLSEAEAAAGFALFCCAQAQGDLVVECRQVSSKHDRPIKKLPARIEQLERLAPDVMLMSLKIPASERLAFSAGQYIDILLNDGQRRSFSLANAPHDEAFLQLHIRHIPGGQFTEQVFTRFKVRDIVRIEGPHGHFECDESSNKPLILLAGGTGFAPIKSLIEHLHHQGDTRPLHLYRGARTRADLYLHELCSEWAQQGGLNYVPVLSEASTACAWSGRSGLVHHAVMADFPDLSAHQVYACGSPAMVDAAKQDLLSHCALPETAFFADAFTFQGH